MCGPQLPRKTADEGAHVTDDGNTTDKRGRVRRQPAKPTGVSGPYRVGRGDSGEVEGAFEQIEYPASKEDIETFMAERFLASLNKELVANGKPPFFDSLVRNAEDDYDFRIKQGRISGYLELTEVVSPSRIRRESGYPEQISYKVIEFAEEIRDSIVKKSTHYGTTKEKVFLLAYSTHWSFVPSETTLMCLRTMLHKTKPVFAAISTSPCSMTRRDTHGGSIQFLPT
jgi:hypothetical protein